MFIIIYYKNLLSKDQKLKQLHFVEEQEVGHNLKRQSPCILKRKTSISFANMYLLDHW